MDDESFKTELLNRLDRIQSLLSYLCAAAKASGERAQAESAAQKTTEIAQAEQSVSLERSRLLDEMQDDYYQAVQKWKSGRGGAGSDPDQQGGT